MSLEFRCANVGVVCKGRVTADTAEELIQKVAAHAAEAHDVPELSQTLIDYAVTTVRASEER